MTKRDEIIKFIFDYFGKDFVKKAKEKDDFVNGVQVKGSEKAKKIALGVNVDVEFLKKCQEWGADFVIVHHGISLDKLNHYLNPILKERFKIIIENNMTLMGLHYLLDAHKKIGNNVQILKRLGAKIIGPFFDEWGWIGELPKMKDVNTAVTQLAEIFNHQPIKYLFGKKKIKRVAVTSGGGTPRVRQMPEFLEKDFDLYVTGETRESIPALTKESGINYLAFGHYDTEKFGVQALGEIIKKKFPDVEVKFIDIPNPL